MIEKLIIKLNLWLIVKVNLSNTDQTLKEPQNIQNGLVLQGFHFMPATGRNVQ